MFPVGTRLSFDARSLHFYRHALIPPPLAGFGAGRMVSLPLLSKPHPYDDRAGANTYIERNA